MFRQDTLDLVADLQSLAQRAVEQHQVPGTTSNEALQTPVAVSNVQQLCNYCTEHHFVIPTLCSIGQD